MPTVKTYTTLIKACTAAGAPNRAVGLFAEMEADGLSADLLAYNSLMGAFSRCGEWGRAWSVLGSMRRAGVDPDIVSYNTLLKACERCLSTCLIRSVSSAICECMMRFGVPLRRC
jgi:pentatricopeptide repeat domain-containing protein 1